MYPRTNYEMTEEDLKLLLEACKPVIAMKIGSYIPDNPQENANRAWQKLGKKMGFEHTTVQPIQGKSTRFFTAVPSETLTQKSEREVREREAFQRARIKEIQNEIDALQKQLSALLEVK